jgi:hypothetical protein
MSSGQFDGDAPRGSNPFATQFGQQPWMRGSVTPWHMWGTVETLTIPIEGALTTFRTQQLSRVNYRRPETWHWLFFARLLQGPTLAGEGNNAGASVFFDVTVGLGRASVTLPGFEAFAFRWTSPSPPPPPDEPKWSTTALRPERGFPPGDEPDYTIFQMVAEDIQCSCRVGVGADIFPQAVPVIIEVGAFFAPKNHIRPDWLLIDQPMESQFPGSEIAGK